MTKSKGKTTTIAAALLIILTMTIALLALPAEKEYATAQITTYVFIGAVPNPVGVNQEVLLHVGITQQLINPDMGWEGLSITIERPDNKTDKIENIRTDATGGTGRTYVPDIEGTYYLQSHFPAQNTTDNWGAEIAYAASDSEVLELVVQAEPIEYYPDHALPTEYWTRPINAQLREWSAISANWLVPTPILPTDNLYAPYNDDAPETAHVLWTKPIGDTMGGLAGGSLGEHSYGIGDAYEGKWVGTCVIGGVVFYNKFDSGQPQQQVVAVDLHTGEELWTKTLLNNMRISFGQVLYWDCLNYHGAFSYLWATSGTTWYAFEPLSGEWRYNMTNVPSGNNVYGPNGEILRYVIDLNAGWLAQWNTSTVVHEGKTSTAESWGSQVRGVTYNATERGFDWNVSIPTGLPGSVQEAYPRDRIIGASISTTEVTIWGLNLDPANGAVGRLLFSNTWDAPDDWAEGDQTISWGAASIETKVVVLSSKERNCYFGFSLETGKNLWGPTASEHYLNSYDRISTINYGTLIASGVSGIVYGYNATTGDLIWTYDAEDPYSEILWANNWWLQQMFIADGKVYLGHVEHSPVDPRPRGAPFICLDVETGDEVWRIDGYRQTCWGGKATIADSIITLQDTYDQRVYTVGKGPSATTVEALPAVSVHGDNIVVKGMVTDISPGTAKYALTARFPHGVPAVSDANMSAWMQYVYMQFERPADVVGVEVIISVLDPNNNCYEVATTTSDASGYFGCTFEPEVPGFYKIVATFEGSKAYYGSFAETFVNVEEAPQPTPEPTPTPASVADLYLVPGIAGIIVAIAVVGALIMLMLRKR